MRSKVERHSEEAEKAVREIRRATRRQYSAEDTVSGIWATAARSFHGSERNAPQVFTKDITRPYRHGARQKPKRLAF
jgi:hypothetical protein